MPINTSCINNILFELGICAFFMGKLSYADWCTVLNDQIIVAKVKEWVTSKRRGEKIIQNKIKQNMHNR
jgi:hypothetical protein